MCRGRDRCLPGRDFCGMTNGIETWCMDGYVEGQGKVPITASVQVHEGRKKILVKEGRKISQHIWREALLFS